MKKRYLFNNKLVLMRIEVGDKSCWNFNNFTLKKKLCSKRESIRIPSVP